MNLPPADHRRHYQGARWYGSRTLLYYARFLFLKERGKDEDTLDWLQKEHAFNILRGLVLPAKEVLLKAETQIEIKELKPIRKRKKTYRIIFGKTICIKTDGIRARKKIGAAHNEPPPP